MDSLAQLRSMFFAVGTAHLPGKKGLITLLREKGYNVSPVISSKKIPVDDYNYTPVPPNWYTYTDKDSIYSVEMPAMPTDAKLYGLVDVNAVMDITKMTAYYSMVVSINKDLDADSLFDAIANNIFSKKEVRKGEKITIGDIAGKEYTGVLNRYTSRVQLFKNENILMMFYTSALKEENVNSEVAERFFNSIKINKITPREFSNYTFTDSFLALSFESPVPLEYNKQLSDIINKSEGWLVDYYNGVDNTNGLTIILLHKKATPGYYLEGINSDHEDVTKTMYNEQTDSIKKVAININGYNGYSFAGKSSKYGYLKIYSIYRGNSYIMLAVSADSAKMQLPEAQNVFNSLNLTDYKKSVWSTQYDSLKTFSTIAPSPFYLDIDSSTWVHTVSYQSYDTNNYTTYYVFTDTLSKYHKVTNIDTFLNDEAKEYFDIENDSVVSTITEINTEHPYAEYIIKKQNSDNAERIRSILYNDVCYTICVYGGLKELTTTESSLFYENFKFHYKDIFDPYSDKTVLLINDLKSNDSNLREDANYSISDIKVDNENVGLLNQYLFDDFPKAFFYSDSTYTNIMIGNKLAATGDKSTIEYIKANYSDIYNRKPELAKAALNVLARIHTKQSYETLAELMTLPYPGHVVDFNLQYHLKDSLELTKTIYGKLLPYLDDTVKGPIVAYITKVLLDSGYLKREDLLPLEKDLIKLAENVRTVTDTSDAPYWYVCIPELLSTINTSTSNNAISNFYSAKSTYLARVSAMYLVKKDVAVPESLFNRIAKDIRPRIDLYNELKKENKLSLFPNKYKTQESLSASRMYDYLYYEDEEPDTVKYLTTHTVTYKRHKYRLHFYEIRYTYGEETESYLGVDGGYASAKALEAEKDFNYVYWDDEYDPEMMPLYHPIVERIFITSMKDDD